MWRGARDQKIPRLTHLQLLLARQPYFGRQLRYFNYAPWWYRLDFSTPTGTQTRAVLRFEGVDYFAKVWLNGTLLGEHEGYPLASLVQRASRRLWLPDRESAHLSIFHAERDECFIFSAWKGQSPKEDFAPLFLIAPKTDTGGRTPVRCCQPERSR
jgi:hypothetical protein